MKIVPVEEAAALLAGCGRGGGGRAVKAPAEESSLSLRFRPRPAGRCSACGGKVQAGLFASRGKAPLCFGCLALSEGFELVLVAALDLVAACWYGLWREGHRLSRVQMVTLSRGIEDLLVERGHAAYRAPAAPGVPRFLLGHALVEDSLRYRLRLISPGGACSACGEPLGGPVAGARDSRDLCGCCLLSRSPYLGHLLELVESARALAVAHGRPGDPAGSTKAALARLARRVLLHGTLWERLGALAPTAAGPRAARLASAADPPLARPVFGAATAHAPAPMPAGRTFSEGKR